MAMKPIHDWAAISRDYASGMAQADIAAKHGTTRATVVRAVRNCMSVGEREIHRQRRLREGAKLASRLKQARKIQRGEILIREDAGILTAEIKGKCFLFDPDARSILENHPWRLTLNDRLHRQATESGKVVTYYIYHDIYGAKPPRGFVIDHINRNVFDNRRHNLRRCTYSENSLNTAAHDRVLARRGLQAHD